MKNNNGLRELSLDEINAVSGGLSSSGLVEFTVAEARGFLDGVADAAIGFKDAVVGYLLNEKP